MKAYREQYDARLASERLRVDVDRGRSPRPRIVPIYSPIGPQRRRRSQVVIRWLSPKQSLALYAWEAIWLAAVMAAAVMIFK